MHRRPGRLLTAMVTPLSSEGSVDLARAAELARALVALGNDGLVVNGTTGESPTLSESERLALLDAVRRAVPDAVVLMGTGSFDTAHAVSMTRQARDHGADLALVVAPYYSRPPQEGLLEHYRAVASVGLPVVLYNIPSRCGVNITADTTLELAGHPGIVGTKESAGDVEQVARICAEAPSGFDVWSGDDAMTLPFMSVGARGVISVASHVCTPALRRLVDAHAGGRIDEATHLNAALLPLLRGLFITANPIPVKAALQHLGVDCGGLRLPLVPLDAPRRRWLGELLDSLGDLVTSPAIAAVATTA